MDVRTVCDGVAATNITDHTGDVHAFLLVYNRTDGTCRLYTDRGVCITTYSSAIGSVNGMGLGRNGTFSSGLVDYVYACAWEGSAAEFAPWEARALLEGLGWDTSGWWTIDATAGTPFPATRGEFKSLLSYYGYTFAPPTHVYPCQETVGPGVVSDSGAATLTAGTVTFGVSVPGYSRTGIQFGAGGYLSTSAHNPSAHSICTLFVMQHAITTNRYFYQYGSNTSIGARMYHTTNLFVVGDGGSSSGGAASVNMQGYFCKYDRANAEIIGGHD